jgi:hypothetical protein
VTDPANPQPLWEFTASTLGETWSVPAIGKVRSYSGSRWVAFMGSGYNNRSYGTAGNVFYAVALESGSALRSVTVSNINTSSISQPYSDIYVSIPGSPAIDDSNNDGYIESVYVGDLDGRLWRMNTTNTDVNQWTFTAIYTDRLNYPIVSRPAIWRSSLDSNSPAHVLFGTGGDDRAPNDRMYAFLSVIDGTSPSVEWYIGNAAALGLSASLATGSFSTGEKVWADPVVADNIVYFNTLKGSIENVNPCLNLEQDGGRLYARALQAASGGLGMSVLKTVAGRVESFAMTSKARRMVTIGDQAKVNGLTKREVYIQEYDSTIERLEQPGARFRIAIKSWREVYQIIR